jgi:hypothetical protein
LRSAASVLLFAALAAGPAIAVGAASAASARRAADTRPAAVEQPSPEQIAQALAALEAESEARQEWLASPEAAEERRRSADAYADISAPEAEQLLAFQFSEQLEALDSDPSRSLSDSTLDRVLGPNAATVTEHGNTALLDSTLPVRAEDRLGRMAKVDLDVRRVGSGFEPENALAPLQIPARADEGIELGPTGLGIAQAGTDAASLGRPFEGANVFYPEAARDTDLMVSPISAGVELFDQLRSSASPEVLSFDLDLPDGAALEPSGGGAEVVDGSGAQVAQIAPPSAVDAQGAEVPATMEVGESSISIRVPHRQGEFAYPILLDPEIIENWLTPSWFDGAGLAALTDGTWRSTSVTGGVMRDTEPIFGKFHGSERGLFVSIPPGELAPEIDGHWAYGVPKPNSFIAGVSLSPFLRDDHNCVPTPSKFQNPHDYDGLWDGGKFVVLHKNDAEESGSSTLPGSTSATSVIIGLNSGGSTIDMPCWRDLYVGGVSIALEDSDQPVLTTTPSAEWIDNAPNRQAVSATDRGLGMKRFKTEAIDVAGTPPFETVNPCTGLHAAPCPETWDLSDPNQPLLNFDPSVLPEGIDRLRITAFDVTEQPSTNSNTITVRVDHAPPELTVSGTLTEQATLGTMRPFYTIKAAAKDGVPGSDNPAEARAGVKSLKFFEDGVEIEPGRAQPECTGTQSCSAAREYEIPTLSRSVGQHVVTVVAEDTVGHRATREIPFEIARDSSPPRLSVANLPADGVLGAHPQEIVASAADEDRGVASLSLQIDGRTVEEARQSCPKGGCSLQRSFAPDLSDLPSGEHAFTIRAEDAQGNAETFTRAELVDVSQPLVALSGSLADSGDMPLAADSALLTIASRDPRPGSGIASVDVELDEAEVTGFPVNCVEKCGRFTTSYGYLAAKAGPGEHTVSVEVADRAGNRTSRAIAVNVPSAAEGTPACSPEVKEVPAASVVTGPQAVQHFEEALPQTLAASKPGQGEMGEELSPTLRPDGGEFEVEGSVAESEISAAPDGGIRLNRIACLTPGETTGAATGAEVVNGDAAVYANTGAATDTVVRPTTEGVMMVHDLRGPEAGQSYSWNVTVNEDEKVVKLPSGAVAIVEPVKGGAGEAADPPNVPNNLEKPHALANGEVQRNVGEYELSVAQTETQAAVVAVIPQPWILLSDQSVIPATISVAPVVLEPNEFIVTVHLPTDEIAASVYPVQVVDAAIFSSQSGSCLHARSPCGSPSLDSADQYAVYWGNPNHVSFNRPARNPYYEDYGDNNCTNFISQIIRAGGQRYMLYRDHGDGTWWFRRVAKYDGSILTAFRGGESTQSWTLADVLPQHLWEYGLFRIDQVQDPRGWTEGDLLAEDWFGTNGRGDFNHLQYVVGAAGASNGDREPLIANESSEGSNYSHMPWEKVRRRIQEAEGDDGWQRAALAWTHTMANAGEKTRKGNLYGPGGLHGE